MSLNFRAVPLHPLSHRRLTLSAYMITTIVLILFSATYRLIMMVLNNPFLKFHDCDDRRRYRRHPTIDSHRYNHLGNGSIRQSALSCPFDLSSLIHFQRPTSRTGACGGTEVDGRGGSKISPRNMGFLLRPQYGFTKALHNHIRTTGKSHQPRRTLYGR